MIKASVCIVGATAFTALSVPQAPRGSRLKMKAADSTLPEGEHPYAASGVLLVLLGRPLAFMGPLTV